MSKMLAELSALFDSELEPHEFERLGKPFLTDPANREAWHLYVLIQDQLKGEPVGARDMVADVMAAVREEPIVFAPRHLAEKHSSHPLLALAASVAGVAVVGWFAFIGDGQPSVGDHRFAAVAPALTFARIERPASAIALANHEEPVRADLSEYLLAHHTHAPTFRLGDGVQHVRTVSVSVRPER